MLSRASLPRGGRDGPEGEKESCALSQTVCEEEERVCVESVEETVLVCEAKVINTGNEKASLSSGRITGTADGNREIKNFVTTQIPPGGEQNAGKIKLPVDGNEPKAVCEVDIYGDVNESDETNNKTEN